MDRRQRNRLRRRERVLAAARALITDGGVEALSMRKLARAAGLAVNTLYSLFGTRDDILEALVDDGMDRLDRVLEEMPPDLPLEVARAIITASIDHIVEEEAVSRPVILAGLRSGGVHGWRDARAIETCRSALAAAMREGLLRDDLNPALLSEQILLQFQHAARLWAAGESSEAEFRARALYGLDLCLLAAATDKPRSALAADVKSAERAIARARRVRKRA